MPPPGGIAVESARWDHKQREGTAEEARPETVESALRVAQTYSWNTGLGWSNSKMRRLVRDYFAARRPNQTFGEWVIAYADPTGETAVRNVMRDQR